MQFALIALLTLHGLLHLLGFAKAWGLAALPQLSGNALVPLSAALIKVVGLGWLAAALMLLAAAALRAARQDAWWPTAVAGVAVSQLLIILQWQDAKAGTAANLLIVAALVLAASAAPFRLQ